MHKRPRVRAFGVMHMQKGCQSTASTTRHHAHRHVRALFKSHQGKPLDAMLGPAGMHLQHACDCNLLPAPAQQQILQQQCTEALPRAADRSCRDQTQRNTAQHSSHCTTEVALCTPGVWYKHTQKTEKPAGFFVCCAVQGVQTAADADPKREQPKSKAYRIHFSSVHRTNPACASRDTTTHLTQHTQKACVAPPHNTTHTKGRLPAQQGAKAWTISQATTVAGMVTNWASS